MGGWGLGAVRYTHLKLHIQLQMGVPHIFHIPLIGSPAATDEWNMEDMGYAHLKFNVQLQMGIPYRPQPPASQPPKNDVLEQFYFSCDLKATLGRRVCPSEVAHSTSDGRTPYLPYSTHREPWGPPNGIWKIWGMPI